MNTLTYQEVVRLIETPNRVRTALMVAANAVGSEAPESFEVSFHDGYHMMPFVFAAIENSDPEFQNQERYAAIQITPVDIPEDYDGEIGTLTLQDMVTSYLTMKVQEEALENLMASLSEAGLDVTEFE